jgi:hypothetical protein
MNTSPGRKFYEKKLRWTFNTEPVDDTGQSKFIDTTWEGYRDAIKGGKIPPFVLNDAVLLDDSTAHISRKMANLNYEMTPWHYGNDAFGYQEDPPPVDLSRAISISGGALDLVSITPGFSQKMFISALNLDIGYLIDNPKYERPTSESPDFHDDPCLEWKALVRKTEGPVTAKERFRQVITPFPFYLGKPWYGRHKGGSRVYLSDAGFSDNLGAFSLIRRMTRQIIIVDAEQEHPDKEHPGQGYQFGAYQTLKEAVRSELDADLSVPTIDKILRHEAEAGFDPAIPVMHGTVTSFPIKGVEKPVVLQVIYVKLSLNVQDLSKYPAVVKQYYDAHDRKQRFPYESTGDQSYDDERFRAYRALGWTIGTCIPNFGTPFEMEVNPQCYVADSPHEGRLP